MKKNYKELLKESVLKEFDTSKTVDIKGPMLDAILSYNGAGELPTHQDASSILERYYYGEKLDKGVDIHEAEQNEISEVPKDSIEATKNEVEDELGGDEAVDKRELGGDAIEEDIEIENTVIEKLIAEMDDDNEKKDDDEDEKKDEKKDETEKELNVDKEVKEDMLPGFKTSTGHRLGTGGNVSTDLEEAFQLFQEQIEDEEDEDEDEEKPLKEAEEKEDDDDEDDEDLKESELFEAEDNDKDDDDDEDDEDEEMEMEGCKYMK